MTANRKPTIPMTSLDQLLADPPLLHVDGAGYQAAWGLSEDLLRIIDAHVGADSRTLETGGGLSTVLFAMKGAQHICVSPHRESVDLIRQFCADNRVSTERVEFVLERSDVALPSMKTGALDLVLIDGGHGFPIPFIDWYYTAGGLRVGGLVVVDDTQLWTGFALKEFLVKEPEWHIYRDFHPRATVFQKVSATDHAKEWTEQAFVVEWSQRSHFQRGVELLRQGQFMTFLRKLGRLARTRGGS